MKVQVIVKKDGRVWDSIRGSVDSAMYRVAEHMSKDADEVVKSVGNVIMQHLIAFGTSGAAIKHLVYMGFEVETKKIPNPTI